jgi:DNA-binding XRE family transcriptional regulator
MTRRTVDHRATKVRRHRRELASNERVRLGQRLKLIREASALTQGALAERCGVSRTTITNIENQGFDATMSTWILLARALRLPLSHLVKSPHTGKVVP